MTQQEGGSHAHSCGASQILIPQLLPQKGQHDHCTQHACDQACTAENKVYEIQKKTSTRLKDIGQVQHWTATNMPFTTLQARYLE